MRTITDASKAALAAGQIVKPFYLVAIEFTSGMFYAWTGINTLVWNSIDWEGFGDFVGVSAITQTADLSAEGITLSLSGINSGDISSAISDVATYLTVDVWLGFLDSSNAVIVDPVHCFSGHVDVPTVQDDGETATISITAENDLLILSQSSQRRYTNDDQQIIYPTDLGFQFVPTVQAWNGAWGGKNGGNTTGAPGWQSFF
jgi:hypothetical protein